MYMFHTLLGKIKSSNDFCLLVHTGGGGGGGEAHQYTGTTQLQDWGANLSHRMRGGGGGANLSHRIGGANLSHRIG